MTEINERCDRQQSTENEVELVKKISDAFHEMLFKSVVEIDLNSAIKQHIINKYKAESEKKK